MLKFMANRTGAYILQSFFGASRPTGSGLSASAIACSGIVGTCDDVDVVVVVIGCFD